MSRFEKIINSIKQCCEKGNISTDNNNAFCGIFQDKGYQIKVRITRELMIRLPHVDDFRICPACGIKHRNRKSLKTGYCKECRNEKFRLSMKGISKKALNYDIKKYNELIGAASLLKKLKKAVKNG